MPQRAKREDVGKPKPKRRRKRGSARPMSSARPAAQHGAPTVQIINTPDGATALKPQIQRKRDGRKINMDLTKQYRGLEPRKGLWRGKHPQRGIKTLEAHKKSILWNLGKGSPGAQQWVIDHIPKLNPALRDVKAAAKDSGKEILIGLAGFLGPRILGNAAGKIPGLSRMGTAGSVAVSAGTALGLWFLVRKKWPQYEKSLGIGASIGVLDSIVKHFVIPHVPSSIAGVLGDSEPALPAHQETLALPAHSSIGDDTSDGGAAPDDSAEDDLHARSVRGHHLLGVDENDDAAELEQLRELVRRQRGMGIDVRPALADYSPGAPRRPFGDDEGDGATDDADDVHARSVRGHRMMGFEPIDATDRRQDLRRQIGRLRGMGFDVRPALAGCGRQYGAFADDGLGFDVHPATAGYDDGLGFDVHPAIAGYDDGLGFDVHPALAGNRDDDGAMADDGFGVDDGMSDDGMGYDEQLAMADSGDGLGMTAHAAQAGVDDMGHYVSTGTGSDEGQGAYDEPATGAFDEGQGAYDEGQGAYDDGQGAYDDGQGAYDEGTGAYVPSSAGMGAYVPASSPMGAYVPMNGVDAEEVTAMIFGGPWALARMNQLRHRRHRHRRRPPHHGRVPAFYNPRTRNWHHFPLADVDEEVQYTADDIRRQRGVMGFDELADMNQWRQHHRFHPYHAHRRRHHPRHHRQHRHPHHPHQRPMHLECDFYLPQYAGYRMPHSGHAMHHRPVHHHGPHSQHPMMVRPPSLQHSPAQQHSQQMVGTPPMMRMPTQAAQQQQHQAQQDQSAMTGQNAGGIFARND